MTVYNKVFDLDIWKQVNQKNKDLLADYMLELRQRKSSKQTIYQYHADLRGFMCYVFRELENRYVLDLGKRDFRKYSLHLIDCLVSNARHNRVLSVIRSMLDYAESEDEFEYKNNEARKVKGLRSESVKDIVFLSNELIFEVAGKLVTDGELQKSALLLLSYDSAGRKSELAQVEKYSFLDSTRNNTNQVRGKGGKLFSLLYFQATKIAIDAWLRKRKDDKIASLWIVGEGNNKKAATSSNIYQWFVEMRKYLGVLEGKEIDFGPHSMRHSSLTNYGNGTHYVCQKIGISALPIDRLRLIAHHESIDTTQNYLPDTSIGELENTFGIKILE